MPVDNDLLFRLVKAQNNGPCIMKIGQNSYGVDSLELNYSEIPLTKPSTRGGVYFSDKMAFKAKVRVSDLGITKVLSKTMLGPNQEFEKIHLLMDLESGEGKKALTIFGNLINYVQKKSVLELNLVVIGTELSD